MPGPDGGAGTLHWRTLIGWCSLLLVPSLLSAYWLPESPIWLMSRGRTADVEVVLNKAAKIQRIPRPPSLPEAALAGYTTVSENFRTYGHNMCMIFKSPLLKVSAASAASTHGVRGMRAH